MNFAQSRPTTVGGLNVKKGESCLPVLAKLPSPFPEPKFFIDLENGSNAATDDAPECLIWIFDSANVSQGTPRPQAAVACDLDENGNFVTSKFLSGGEIAVPTAGVGYPCTETLAELESRGGKARTPFAASLDGNGENGGGGLMWTVQQPGSIDVLICSLNEQGDQLVASFRENEVGPVDTNGAPCFDELAKMQRKNAKTTGPIPVPRAGPDTSDPGCLFWDIDGGTILESSNSTGN